MPSDRSLLPKLFQVFAWTVLAACTIGIIVSGLGGNVELVPYFLVAGFAGGLAFFSAARILSLLEQIRDAAVRTATAAENEE